MINEYGANGLSQDMLKYCENEGINQAALQEDIAAIRKPHNLESQVKALVRRFSNISLKSRPLDIDSYANLEQLDMGLLQDDMGEIRKQSTIQYKVGSFQRRLKDVGITPGLVETGLLGADSLICGEYQIPAYLFYEAGGSLTETKTIAKRRLITAATHAANMSGIVMATWGASSESPNKLIGAVGVGIQAAAKVVDNPTRNRLGNHWHLRIGEVMCTNEHLLGMLRNDLIQAGFSGQEINDLENLSNYAYSTELISSRLDRLSNLVTPFAVGGVMASYESYFLAKAIITLGLAAIPIGEISYLKSNVQKRAANRAARSAKATDWLRVLGRDHINLVTFLNSVAQSSRFVQALTLGFSYSNPNIVSNLWGLEFGLNGLNGALSQQRGREDARRYTKMSKKMIELLSSKYLILTDKRWREHIEKNGIDSLEDPMIENGIIIHEFKTKLPNGKETNLPPVNLTAEQHKVIILIGKSGDGKSTFFSGPLHVAEHTGDLFIVNNGKAMNVHELQDARDIDNYIRLVSSNNLVPSSRIVDAFKKQFSIIYKDETSEIHDDDKMLWKHATQVSDNLLETQINDLEQNNDHSFYPQRLLEPLKKLRIARISWVNNLLAQAGGNLIVPGISATSGIGDGTINGGLSQGQKQRITMLVAETCAQVEPELKAIILDEPLDKLDEGENLQLQLDSIKRIQQANNAPALIIISHQHVYALQRKTGAEIIDLNNPNHQKSEEEIIKSNGVLVH